MAKKQKHPIVQVLELVINVSTFEEAKKIKKQIKKILAHV